MAKIFGDPRITRANLRNLFTSTEHLDVLRDKTLFSQPGEKHLFLFYSFDKYGASVWFNASHNKWFYQETHDDEDKTFFIKLESFLTPFCRKTLTEAEYNGVDEFIDKILFNLDKLRLLS